MRPTFAAILMLAAACGGHIIPVAGAREAAARHYPVTVAAAHDAITKVLTDRYHVVVHDDGREVIGGRTCRTDAGGSCSDRPGEDLSANSTAAPSIGARSDHQLMGGDMIQVVVRINGADGDITLQIGGRGYVSATDRDPSNHEYNLDAPDAPAWMPHEADEVRVAIDAALAH